MRSFRPSGILYLNRTSIVIECGGNKSGNKRSADKRICNYACPHFEGEGDYLLFIKLTVTVHESVYATGCVDKLALTGVERVRGA